MGVRLGYRYQDGLKPTSCLGLSALPPDVRRGLCPAVSHSIDFGLCPWSGFSPATEGRARTRGAARTFAASLTGGAKPTPHIRRQSRSASNSSLLGAKQVIWAFALGRIPRPGFFDGCVKTSFRRVTTYRSLPTSTRKQLTKNSHSVNKLFALRATRQTSKSASPSFLTQSNSIGGWLICVAATTFRNNHRSGELPCQ